MELNSELLDHLICPRCEGNLSFQAPSLLLCKPCRLRYPIEEGIPHLDYHVATPWMDEEKGASHQLKKACFYSPSEEGVCFTLEAGTCCLVGRYLDDRDQTQLKVSLSGQRPLDSAARKVVQQILIHDDEHSLSGGETIANFSRTKDVIVSDPLVSRLHALIYYHPNQGLGLIDLVSRNGTFVNDREIENVFVKPGDIISMGESKFFFEFK